MKQLFKSFIFLFLFTFVACDQSVLNSNSERDSHVETLEFTTHEEMADYFERKVGDQQVLVKADVFKILADDNDGSRHQRFIIRLESNQTILVAHNIDLANRIPNLETGDEIVVYGEFEWNDKGGVIHWTHHDPQNKHLNGYIKYKGELFQ